MAAIVNALDVSLQATSPRIVPITAPTHVTTPNTQVSGLGALATQNGVDWSAQVSGAGKPADYADATVTILGASGTSIVMTNANLFKSASGMAGVFVGSGGIFGKDSLGATTFSIDGGTGAAYFKGDVETAGKGRFDGDTDVIGGWSWAVTGGSVRASAGKGGLYGRGERGVMGEGDGPGSVGVYGGAPDGYFSIGVFGQVTGATNIGVFAQNNTSGIGLFASAGAGGTAVHVEGKMEITDKTLVANLNPEFMAGYRWNGDIAPTATALTLHAPAATSAGERWLQIYNTAGTLVGYIPFILV